MKIFLDDTREAPDGWTLMLWPQEVINALSYSKVSEISLDHDLGNDNIGTGYDVLVWIEYQVINNNFIPPKISIHTANPVARKRIYVVLDRILNYRYT